MTLSITGFADSPRFRPRWLAVSFAAAVCLAAGACAFPRQQKAFDPKTCLQDVPASIEGFRIVQGPRTERSIIRNMVPPICNSRMLFEKMRAEEPSLKSGTALLRVVVEYTGEVKNVSVQETTIPSVSFLTRMTAMIENSDFVFWARDDRDTVFFYPVRFGR